MECVTEVVRYYLLIQLEILLILTPFCKKKKKYILQ
jgi:hypothetical protein